MPSHDNELAALDAMRALGATVSDGPIADFAGGWAKAPMIGNRAHYWRVRREWTDEQCGQVQGMTSLCGVDNVAYRQVPILGAGNWQRCTHCERQARILKLA